MATPFDKIIDSLGGQLDQLLNESKAQEDIKKSAKAILQAAIERLDLVSREEFDAQAEVLAKTRAKLDAIEAQLKP